MKKWLSIYLVLNLLVVNLPQDLAISICRLGNLVKHYVQHHSEMHEHNVFAFLSAHYAGHDHHEADHADHENLPFHHHHGDFSHATAQPIFVLPQSLEKPAFIHIRNEIVVMNFFAPSWYSTQILGDIWQPPKA